MKTRNIYVCVDTRSEYGRDIVRGVIRFREDRPNWRLKVVDPNSVAKERAAGDKPAGVIAQLFNEGIEREVAAWGVPCVNVSSRLYETRFPRVMPDNAQVGAKVARYFIDKGFKTVGFCGLKGFLFMDERYAALEATARKAGCTVLKLESGEPGDIERWLAEVPKPIAVLAADDNRGKFLIDACQSLDIKVPSEVAVVGVGNEELVCALGSIPMSSVQLRADAIGHEAAAILDRMVRGGRARRDVVRIRCGEVVSRDSSSVLAIKDDVVVEAMHYIAEHAAEGIKVMAVCRHCGMSRRMLERRFELATGRTVAKEIRNVRLDSVRRMLADSHLSIEEISRRAGFNDHRRLCVIFRAHEGVTPRQYRRRMAVR